MSVASRLLPHENETTPTDQIQNSIDIGVLTEQRHSEFAYLTSLYTQNVLGGTFSLIEESRAFSFTAGAVTLMAHVAITYPAYPPAIEIILAKPDETRGFSRTKLFELDSRLRGIIYEKRGEPVLLALIQGLVSFVEQVGDDIAQNDQLGHDNGHPIVIQDKQSVDDWIRIQKVAAVEVLDHKAAQSFMGSVTIDTIVAKLPPNVRLLHAEVVLRPHLVRQFKATQQGFIEKYANKISGQSRRRRQDAAADKWSQVEVVFHGSLRRHIGSIVQNGFIPPGCKTRLGETVNVRCGSTFGKGTYTSPEPSYSLSYTDTTANSYKLLPGEKLIVCASLMGRRYQVIRGESRSGVDSVQPGYDSHVSPSGMEYVTFNPTQLLPLYVLHLENAATYHWNPNPPVLLSSVVPSTSSLIDKAPVGASLATKRKLLTSQARSRLPFGFGAATGSKFVVEEIAPIDDDEEMWGEFHEDIVKRHLEELDSLGEFQSMRLG